MLPRSAAAAGAEIIDHVVVDRIERAGNTLALSTSAGDMHAASVVVAAGGPDVAARLLGVEASVLGDPGPRARATCLELGLATLPDTPVLFSTDAPLYFSTHMPPAQLGPAGTTVVHMAKYLAPGEAQSPEVGLQECGTTPGPLESIRAVRTCSPPIPARHDRHLRHPPSPARWFPRPASGGGGREAWCLPGRRLGRSKGMLVDAAMASARDAAGRAVRQAALATP